MKKEKQVKSYSRKTKSGKMVTVKAHTAKYDSAEDIAKEILKKKGAGGELEAFKKKGELDLAKIDAYKGDPNELSEKEQQAWQILTGNYPGSSEKKLRKMKSLEKVWAYADAKGKKKSPAKAPKETKSSDKQSLSQADFKAWYHWDMDSDPNNESAKRAEKCLKKKLGAKKYKELLNKETENYSSRGHVKSFKALSEAMEDNTAVRGAKKVKGAATAQKEMAKQMGATDAVKKFDKKIAEAKNTIKSKDTKYGRSKLDSDIVKSAATKHKLAYDEDGHYVDKNGQTYDISPKGKVTKRKYKYDSPDAYSHPDKDKKVSVAKSDKKRNADNSVKADSFMNATKADIGLTRGQIKKIAARFGASEQAVGSWFVEGNLRNEFDRNLRKVLGNKVYEKASMNGRMREVVLKALKPKRPRLKNTTSKSKSSEGNKDPNADFMSAIKADISTPVKAKGKFALGDATLRKQKLRKVLKEMRSGSLDKKGAIKILGYDPSKK